VSTSWWRSVGVTLALFILALISAVAHAGGRVALVIGNSAYKHAAELANPKYDAADMMTALKAVGFQVIQGLDSTKSHLIGRYAISPRHSVGPKSACSFTRGTACRWAAGTT